MNTANQEIPLFAFATAMEFSKVFPEDFAALDTVPTNTLIPLSKAFVGGFACVLGVGILNFSINLTRLLLECEQNNVKLSAVINVGICGAYPNRGLSLGNVVLVKDDRVGDLGCQERDGSFTSWTDVYKATPQEAAPAFIQKIVAGLNHVSGVTVNCCTGTASTALSRAQSFDCDVESMEGAACFAVCEKMGTPAYQIRTVSNIASDRDKSQWKIAEALEALRNLFHC